MKRLGGPILIGLGMLFVVLAIGVRFVVAPLSVQAPLQIPAK